MDVSNYRPISLLSVFNQIFERLVCKRLTSFLEKHNIFFDNQFGFRSKRSTTHAVLTITDMIQQAIDKGKVSCGLFLDLSKAFDTVNHTILLKKLEHYGIRGIALEWFKSYLCNRKQFTVIGGTSSSVNCITCGVPQGSVLGPILFLLYINDFNNCSSILKFNIFADDSNLFHTDDNLLKLETTINNELKYVFDWLCANKLSLSIEKTNFVLFHPHQKKHTSSIILTINNKPIKQESSVDT